MIFAGKDCPHGIDVNVWNSAVYGDHPFKGIVITAYPMTLTADGYQDTNTSEVLVSIDTPLSQEEWGEDEWYGLTDDTAPGDVPGEILEYLRPHFG